MTMKGLDPMRPEVLRVAFGLTAFSVCLIMLLAQWITS